MSPTTAAILMILRYYFDERRYQKVTTSVWSFNDASLRRHEKLGFVVEGRLRRTVYREGRHHNQIMVGMMSEEFRTKYGNGG